MELRQLKTFLQVAQNKSFSTAAKNLGLTQSAVTIQIKNLETELGTRLFDRMGKTTELTSRGAEFLKYALDILNRVDDAAQAMTGDTKELKNTIRLGVNESLCAYKVPEIITHFSRNHPKVNVSVMIGRPDQLYNMLEKNQVDMIYVLDSKRYSDHWIKTLEAKEPVVLTVPAFSELAGKRDLDFEEIIDYPFFLTESGQNYRFALDQYLAQKGMTVHPNLECMNTKLLLSSVKENNGIALLPYYTVKEALHKGEVSIIEVKDFDIEMYRQIFYHKDKWKSPEMDEFIRITREQEEKSRQNDFIIL